MGVRDEELVQKLISLDTTASLQDVINTCRSYEATRKAISAILIPPSLSCASLLLTRSRRDTRKQLL